MLSKSVSDWERDADKKAAAVSFSLRVLMLVFPVRSVDKKLLPDSANSVCVTYNNSKMKSMSIQPQLTPGPTIH